MNSVSTGSPARSQLGFCFFVSVGLGGIFKVGLGINGAAAYLYRALRPAPQAPQPGPHCARRPHGVTPRLRRARRGPRPTARPGLHWDKPNPPSAPGTNHPLREPCLAQGTSAAAFCPEGLAMETPIAALAPVGKAAHSPRDSAASRCRSWSPVGSRSIENLISHLRRELWDLPRCHPGGSETPRRWC